MNAATRPKHEHVVHFESTNSDYLVSEETTLDEMKEERRIFFETSHGENETFTVYRGQLIVRNTVQFTGTKKERKTAVYLFLIESLDQANHMMPDLFHAGWPKDTEDAKRRIDHLLDGGKYVFSEGN